MARAAVLLPAGGIAPQKDPPLIVKNKLQHTFVCVCCFECLFQITPLTAVLWTLRADLIKQALCQKAHDASGGVLVTCFTEPRPLKSHNS